MASCCGKLLIVVAGCCGWLLWLVAVAGCCGWLLWLVAVAGFCCFIFVIRLNKYLTVLKYALNNICNTIMSGKGTSSSVDPLRRV